MSNPGSALNLGPLNGPVLVFGGPYSNFAATLAMRQRAKELAIPPARVICTGDVIAYCAEPQETLQLIRDWGIAVVQGNCEESLGADAPDCGCGFDEGTTCSLLSVEWYQYATQRVSADERHWMQNLPKSLSFELAGKRVRVVHGGVRQINRFIFPSTPEAVKRKELVLAGSDVLIGGHSGIPWGEKIDNRAWLNSGVIGMPANDGSADGWYLLLSPESDNIRCSWRRLSYAADQSRHTMCNAGLQSGYAEALTTGLWPSMDVLPADERARRGDPIVREDMLC
ncbi:metallophosphoesterase family protein [Geopsychrobacter electrodiphilus]|uniref:metallophosphoesterase family protein n=1 Tax=Geopsychrobacter electrodiphilus TaxID=225196 RepID=UPI00035EC12F|nr:metallophosphoesterase family protein [Geopsychrobacter electrodiphilus]